MNTEGQLLINLSSIKTKRVVSEIKLLNLLDDPRNEIDPKLEKIIADNWKTDKELEGRFFEV